MKHQKKKTNQTEIQVQANKSPLKEGDNNKSKIENNQIASIKASYSEFVGPIPPPAIMGGYKEIDPSFPNRILTMAEDDLKTTHRMQFLGWASVYSLSVVLIVGGIILIIMDKPMSGFVTLATSAIFPIIQLFFSRKS